MLSVNHIEQLIEKHSLGYALSRDYYCDSKIFNYDREKGLDPLWHIAGHAARIPNPGLSINVGTYV